MWSNTKDMANFTLMLLNAGQSPHGQTIISQENLSYLWSPRVDIDPTISYGLGWNIEDYHGLTVYFHPGGTVGFASELVIIPELDVGFVFLTNKLDQVVPLGRLATYRLLEMLTGSDQVYDRHIGRSERAMRWQLMQLNLVTKKKVNPDKIAPLLGAYHNEILGRIELVLHDDGTLWVDFGEYESLIRPLFLQENQFIFLESVFVGKTITLRVLPDGSRTIQWTGDEGSYTFAE